MLTDFLGLEEIDEVGVHCRFDLTVCFEDVGGLIAIFEIPHIGNCKGVRPSLHNDWIDPTEGRKRQ